MINIEAAADLEFTLSVIKLLAMTIAPMTGATIASNFQKSV